MCGGPLRGLFARPAPSDVDAVMVVVGGGGGGVGGLGDTWVLQKKVLGAPSLVARKRFVVWRPVARAVCPVRPD